MKDKILEAVQISKTYGEGESAVQALKASKSEKENTRKYEEKMMVEEGEKIYYEHNSGQTDH